MRRRNVMAIGLILNLSGCGWIEEQQRRALRARAETAFVDAVGAGNVEAVRARLQQDRTLANAIRRVRGEDGDYPAESALTFALHRGQRDMAELLLEQGADPNRVDGKDASPLSVALLAEKDRRALVALLLERGAKPDAAVNSSGSTALHQAAGSSSFDEEILALLIAKAPGLGGPDAQGWTPLHSAAGSANVEAIRLLIARGADRNGPTLAPRPPYGRSDDVAGATPLAIVARDRQIAAAAALCALGADPDIEDSTHASARKVAARVAAEYAAAEAARSAKGAPVSSDVLRHHNMAAFLAPRGGCDALLARKRAGEDVPAAEVDRIANESECETGWGWACGKAGWAYHRSEGAREDKAKALALFRKGCETVVTKSQWCCGMVGIFYMEGISVPRDPVEGAAWLSKGCEADPARADEQACHRLGLAYVRGSGVFKDLARAQSLFKKACAAGYKDACANLERHGGS